MDGQGDYYGNSSAFSNVKLKDLEEKQNIMKERLLLIGQNLIDSKEEHDNKILEMKKDIEVLKGDMEKVKIFLETISQEMGKFAKKEDLDILGKQMRMFQPLKFLKEKR